MGSVGKPCYIPAVTYDQTHWIPVQRREPLPTFYYHEHFVEMLDFVVEHYAHVLFDEPRIGLAGSVDRKEALRETGALIHRMGRAGVHHPDLNAKNVLLSWSGGAPVGYVLDLDRASVGPKQANVGAMVRRLLRSIRKFERRTGLEIPASEKELLVDVAHGGSGS